MKNLTLAIFVLAAPSLALAQKGGAAPAPAPKKEPAKEAAAAPVEKPKAKPKSEKHGAAGDLADMVARWQDLKAKGTLDAAAAKSLAKDFHSFAGSHPELAATAHFNAGTLMELAGDTKDAESHYQNALRANPKYWPAINNLGEMALRAGDKQKARAQFQAAIDADKLHASSAYNNMGLMLFTDGRENNNPALYKDAIGQVRRALAIDADSMPAYATLALIYYTMSETDRSKLQLAELVVKTAVETNKDFAPIYNTRGLIKLRRRLVSSALKDFEKAVELDPNFVEAHLNIGAIALSSRQYDKAQKSFEVVIKIQPNSFDATVGLGVALRGQKKYDDAEGFYKKAQQLDNKNCTIAFNLGLLYQDYKLADDNKNLRQAQDFYRQFISCSGGKLPKRVEDANRRIKDIDDTFKAIEEAKKIEAEAKKIQEEADKQMQEMKEMERKQQEALEKQRAGEKKPDDKKPDAPPGGAPPPGPAAPEKK